MMSKQWFHYTTDDGHKYELGCEYMLSGKRIRLISADLYNDMGDYKGAWMRENMPIWLIHEIERWLHGDPSFAVLSMHLGQRNRFK